MTSETRTLIDLTDIEGIEFECPDCHVKVIYSLTQPMQFTRQCPNCNAAWFEPNLKTPPTELQPIEIVRSTFNNLRNIAKDPLVRAHTRLYLKKLGAA